jgi:hypothetical protein
MDRLAFPAAAKSAPQRVGADPKATLRFETMNGWRES